MILEFSRWLWCCGNKKAKKHTIPIPIGSMYGIYANIWGILMVNVTIYSIHGSYGIDSWNTTQWLSRKKSPWANRETHGNLRLFHANIYRKPWLLFVFTIKKRWFPLKMSHEPIAWAIDSMDWWRLQQWSDHPPSAVPAPSKHRGGSVWQLPWRPRSANDDPTRILGCN